MATDNPKPNQTSNEPVEPLPSEPTFPVDQYITESLDIDISPSDTNLSDFTIKDE